ncbi:MAG: hypothetical protein AUG83_04465 [Acidobacteria bacterium 13_1_20CM_4_57_11]|nr:MAG: hypothetical protein AUG83_04465 [Acidobacteria bacterium 13_1_20CM_4_57_11]
MQELLRHSTIRVTLDTYTQAVTTEKRNAQEAVSRSCSEKKRRRRKLCLENLSSGGSHEKISTHCFTN